MQRTPCTSAIKISSSKPRCSILIEYSRTRRHLVHRMNPRTNKKLDLVVLPCPSLFPHQPSQPLQEHDGPEQPPKKARARFTGEMGLGKEGKSCLFCGGSPSTHLRGVLPIFEFMFLHIEVTAKNHFSFSSFAILPKSCVCR